MSMTRALRVLLIALLAASATAQAAAICVSPSGNDANNGQTWLAAKRTVQAGLDAAAPGGQVWVAAGTYVETIWMVSDVSLYGGFADDETDLAQRDWTANPTILDGSGLGRVVTAPGSATAATRIDGFTMRNGDADSGGGIYCVGGSSPTIANNTITGNHASSDGGGIFCASGSSPTITNNTIAGNSATYGGGIHCDSSSPTITGNTIAGNTATSLGGGIGSHWSFGTIAGNTIAGNSSADAGGGIYCYHATNRIASNTIVGNAASSDGGGICCDYSTPTIAGNTIAGNRASDGGAIFSYNASPTVADTIVAFNSSGIGKSGATTPSLGYNCVFGNRLYNYSGLTNPTGTNGNISADPLFTSASPGPDGVWGTTDDTYTDLHLLPGSPCRNTGDPAFVPAPGETDIDAQPRVMPDRVDIGADEFTWLGDANLDGYVDVVDLLSLVYAFGTYVGNPGYDPTCDFNHDGAIDVVDLLDIVYNFGN